MIFRPGGARMVAYGVGVILIVLTVAITIALPAEIRGQFKAVEVGTLLLLLGSTLVGLHAVTRSFVKVSDDELFVRNGFRDHHVSWDTLHGVSFGRGAPWPTAVTHDGDRIILFAIQGTDGTASTEAVATIRTWIR